MSSSPFVAFQLILSSASPVATLAALVLLVRFYRLTSAFPLLLIGLTIEALSGFGSAGFVVVMNLNPDFAQNATWIHSVFQLSGFVSVAGHVCLLTGLVLVVSKLHSEMSFLRQIVETQGLDSGK